MMGRSELFSGIHFSFPQLKCTCNRAHTYTHKSLQEHIELNNIINNYNAQINAVNINRQRKMGMGRFPEGNHGTTTTQLSLSEIQLCRRMHVFKNANGLDAVRAMET